MQVNSVWDVSNAYSGIFFAKDGVPTLRFGEWGKHMDIISVKAGIDFGSIEFESGDEFPSDTIFPHKATDLKCAMFKREDNFQDNLIYDEDGIQKPIQPHTICDFIMQNTSKTVRSLGQKIRRKTSEYDH